MKEKSCELRRTNLLEQNEKLNRKKTISVWSIVILLTLLVLVGNYLGNGKTNAKYVASINGTDTARVACFVSDLTSLTAESNVILSPLVSDWVPCYTFTVSNEKSGKVSEVTMDYDLHIDISGPVGVLYRVKSADGLADRCAVAESVGNVIDTSGGIFRAGVAGNHAYVIEAKWNGASSSYQNANVPISANVSCDVTQKD